MATEWHYSHDGQRHGPVSLEDLKRLLVSGQLQLDELVWKTGMPDWLPAKDIEELFPKRTSRSMKVPSLRLSWFPALVVFVLGTLAATGVIRLAHYHHEAERALTALGEQISDSDVVFLIGKHLRFVNGDGIEDAPSLLTGNDPKVRELVIAELAPPTSPAEQIKLGDRWWESAGNQVGPLWKNMQERSAYWYRKALPNLAKPDETRVRKRLNEIAGQPTDFVVLNRKTDLRPSKENQTARSTNLLLEVKVEQRGQAHAGVELQGACLLNIAVTASPEVERRQKKSFVGFIVDYDTAAGYTKRVALSIGDVDKDRTAISPAWGKHSVPDKFVALGKERVYELDMREWAPPDWNGRFWFTATLQQTNPDVFLTAQIIPLAEQDATTNKQ